MADVKKPDTAAAAAPAAGATSERPVQSASPIGKPSSKAFTKWLVVILVVGVLGFVIAAFVNHRHGGTKQEKSDVAFRYPPIDMTHWQAAGDTTYLFDVKKPFYQRVEISGLQPGDLLEVHAEGVYGFDSFIRRAMPDVVSPDGFQQKPADMPRIQKPSRYALKSAGLGALLGVFGEVVYDEDHIPHVEGTSHFFVGKERYIIVPDVPTPKLHLMLNEPWVRGAWDDNWGRCTVKLTRYRPV